MIRQLPCREATPDDWRDLERLTADFLAQNLDRAHRVVTNADYEPFKWSRKSLETLMTSEVPMFVAVVEDESGRIIGVAQYRPTPANLKPDGIVRMHKMSYDAVLDRDTYTSALFSLFRIYCAQIYLDAGATVCKIVPANEYFTNAPEHSGRSREQQSVVDAIRREDSATANTLPDVHIERSGTRLIDGERRVSRWRVDIEIRQENIDRDRAFLSGVSSGG